MPNTNLPDEEKPAKISLARTQLLTIIQLILCVIVIAGAFVIKTIGGEWYAAIGTWFFDHYNNSIFTDTADSPLSFLDPSGITETSRHSDSTVPEKPDDFEESKS